MIKHGPIQKKYGKKHMGQHSHLRPIKDFITKGVADALETVIIQPMACDVRGAKRFDTQQCVIAKAVTRVMEPQAVAIGRHIAFVVIKGLALRFRVPVASRRVIEEFDAHGRVRRAPIELRRVIPNKQLTKRTNEPDTRGKRNPNEPKRKHMKKVGVRAIGGGITV